MTLRFHFNLAKNLCYVRIKLIFVDGDYDYNNVSYAINITHEGIGGKIDFENKKLILSQPFTIIEYASKVGEKAKFKTINSIKIPKDTMFKILDAKDFNQGVKN